MTRLKWGTRAQPLQGYYAWEKWREGGSQGPRPYLVGGATKWVPLWAWDVYKLRHPKPPPVQARSPFDCVGMFTAHDPLTALPYARAGKIQAVALKADGTVDKADPAVGAQFRALGVKVYVWEAENYLGMEAVRRYGATAYIAQAENWQEFSRAVDHKDITVPKALVSNITFLPVPQPNEPPSWPVGWDCMGEAYMNVNVHATPENMAYEAAKRGAEFYTPVFAVYDGASEWPWGRLVPLSEYWAHWPNRSNNWIYMTEYLQPGQL